MTPEIGPHVRVPAGRLFEFFDASGRGLGRPVVIHGTRAIVLAEHRSSRPVGA